MTIFNPKDPPPDVWLPSYLEHGVDVTRKVLDRDGIEVPWSQRDRRTGIAVRFNVKVRSVEVTEDPKQNLALCLIAISVPERDSGRSIELRFGHSVALHHLGEKYDLPLLIRSALQQMLLHEVDEAIVVERHTRPFDPHAEPFRPVEDDDGA